MIISDLQHIESATESEVKGGYDYCKPVYCPPVYCKPPYNEASAVAGASALGKNTSTSTETNAVVISGQASQSYSGSTAKSW